jgi:DNA-directed RNA polymerase specialized sigma24 family protein
MSSKSYARPVIAPVRRAVRRSVRLHHRDDRPDAQLWRAWMQRDRRAFEELFNRYHPRVCALATSMRLGREDAQDVAQETLLGLSIARCRFFPRDGLGDFIRSLAAVVAQRRGRDNLQRGQSLLALEDLGGKLVGSAAS